MPTFPSATKYLEYALGDLKAIDYKEVNYKMNEMLIGLFRQPWVGTNAQKDILNREWEKVRRNETQVPLACMAARFSSLRGTRKGCDKIVYGLERINKLYKDRATVPASLLEIGKEAQGYERVGTDRYEMYLETVMEDSFRCLSYGYYLFQKMALNPHDWPIAVILATDKHWKGVRATADTSQPRLAASQIVVCTVYWRVLLHMFVGSSSGQEKKKAMSK